MNPVEIVEAQVRAYNAQDLDGFCACFAEDCVIADLNGAVSQQGRAELRERYQNLFAQYPLNRARIVNRTALGNVVIDYEIVQRSPELRIEAIAIYSVRDGFISRVDFVRAA